jgi:hypothetical protein
MLPLYFENPVGRVLEHPDGYAVVEYHAGKRKLNELQAFLTHTGQLLQRRSWNRLLGDQRLLSPFTDEESAWILNYWLDRPANQQIWAAVILPNDVFARLSVSQMVTEAKAASLTYRLFNTADEAAAWLRGLH